ncbi:MAG: hypothetical protein ACPG5B_13825 [Chitinophagales bacterium]
MKTTFKYLLLFFLLHICFDNASAKKNDELQLRAYEQLDTTQLKNGDLVFFGGRTKQAIVIRIATASPYTHVGMVMVNPDDGSIWLTHATSNNYKGYFLPIYGETEDREGIILTRLRDSFYDTRGEYRVAKITSMNVPNEQRPSFAQLFERYQNYKDRLFESKIKRFALSAFDLNLFGMDFFQNPSTTDSFFCSEYLMQVLRDLKIMPHIAKSLSEYTPADLTRLELYKPLAKIKISRNPIAPLPKEMEVIENEVQKEVMR